MVDDDRRLVSLITRKDIIGTLKYPLATKCRETNQLLVGAAVSTHLADRERIRALHAAGVDLFAIVPDRHDQIHQIKFPRSPHYGGKRRHPASG